ncbi:MAG: dehalogenase [Anaerolineae bacterium]|nr:dehalogenase [Anaerolineae bacterium]MBL6966271.1 dehalogenase [Anaerolineales bacterium]
MWLILGLVLGAGVYWLVTTEKVKLTWYEWVLVVVGVILLLYGIENYSASQLELEPRAGGFLLLIFGLPGLILAAVAGVLAFLRAKKA